MRYKLGDYVRHTATGDIGKIIDFKHEPGKKKRLVLALDNDNYDLMSLFELQPGELRAHLNSPKIGYMTPVIKVVRPNSSWLIINQSISILFGR